MGCPRPVGFDVTDWLGSGAAHHAGFLVVEFDRQGGVGDEYGDDLPGVDSAQGDLLPQTTMRPAPQTASGESAFWYR